MLTCVSCTCLPLVECRGTGRGVSLDYIHRVSEHVTLKRISQSKWFEELFQGDSLNCDVSWTTWVLSIVLSSTVFTKCLEHFIKGNEPLRWLSSSAYAYHVGGRGLHHAGHQGPACVKLIIHIILLWQPWIESSWKESYLIDENRHD